MNKRISKWPSKVLNLLVVLSMVISLCAILAPVALAQADMDVTINQPGEGASICLSQEFVVKGFIANTGEGNLIGVTAQLNETLLGGSAHIVAGGGDNPQVLGDLMQGASDTFEWTLHCDAGGPITIEVIGNSTGSTANGPVGDSNSVTANQVPDCVVDVATYTFNSATEKLEIDADNSFGVGSVFYINGAVTNPTAEAWTNVTMEISGLPGVLGTYTALCTSGNLTEFADYSETWVKDVGRVKSKEVGEAWWKVKCCDEGTGNVTVQAYGNHTVNGESVWEELCSDTITITQTGDAPHAKIVVEILEPLEHEVGFCEGQGFAVKARITNMTGTKLTDVHATIEFGPPDYGDIVLLPPYTATVQLDDLAAHGNHTLAWWMECAKSNTTLVTVTADSDQTGPGDVQSDHVHITQSTTEAGLSLVLTSSQSTVCAGCEETFQITAKVCNTGCGPAEDVTAELKVTGDPDSYSIAEDLFRDVGDDGVLGPHGGGSDCGNVTWNVTCLDEGTLTFQVTARGVDTATHTSITPEPVKTVDVTQDSLIVRIINPAGMIENTNDPCMTGEEKVQGRIVSVGQQYSIEAMVRNCRSGNDQERNTVAVTIDLPDDGSIVLRSDDAHWEVWNETHTVLKDSGDVGNTATIIVPKICGCCNAYVRWPVECKWSTDDPTTTELEGEPVVVSVSHEGDYDEDCVTIVQQCKAHLMAGLEVFAGSFADGSFQTEPTTRIGVGQVFTVVAAVTDIGQSPADSVTITLVPQTDITMPGLGYGNATTSDPLSQTISYIPGLSTRKAVWEFTCTGMGPVSFDLTGLHGRDVNWDIQIHNNNIDYSCTWEIEQVQAEWTVEIINPTEGEVVNQCTDFAVKARITNPGDSALTNVIATIYWDDDGIVDHAVADYDDAEFVIGGGVHSPSPDSYARSIPSVPAGGWVEPVWNLHCTWGDASRLPNLFIEVRVSTAGFTNEESARVNISQYYVPEPCKPCVSVDIISPGPNTVLATGQEFLVTARVNNTSGCTAEGVVVVLWDWDLVEPIDDSNWIVGDVDPGDELYNSWVFRAVETGNVECGLGTAYIQVDAYKNNSPGNINSWCSEDTAKPTVIPAASLVVENVQFLDMQRNALPSSTVFVCDEFIVRAKVVNYGEADAWNVMATLSAFPVDSVRIAGGEAGYEKPVVSEGDLGSHLVGWGQEGTGYVEWTLHCKQACETTITITPSGQDECGYHYTSNWDYLYPLPGREIDAKFIVPASLTIKQLEQGVDLAITKKAQISAELLEQMVTFTVVVTNNGPKNASGVRVTDTWTADAFADPNVIAGYPTQGSQPTFDDGFIWNVGGLPADTSATLKYSAVANTDDEIVNTAEVTCAEGDGIPENNQAVVRLNVSNFKIPLSDANDGWNLISLPLIPTDGNITVVMSNVGDLDNVDGVYYYDASTQGWTTWAPGWASDLYRMDDGKGYWVKMNADDELAVYGSALNPGNEAPPAYDVYVGWNLIGFKAISPEAANVYLNGIPGLWSMMLGYSGAYYQVLGADMMEPGSGYWLAVPGSTLGTKVGTIFPGF